MTGRKAKNVVNADQSIVPLVVPNQRNLRRFLTDSNLPQIVCIYVKESKFLVNSIVLSLHSSVFEGQILNLTPGNHTLFLDEDLLDIDDIESIVRDCLAYIHGENVRLTYSNVHYFCKFATVYKINPLISSCKSFIDEHLGNLTIQELLENYSDVDKAINHRSSSTNYIKKNCRRIIEDILSVEGSPIICGLKENVEFLKFLVESSSSENCGKLLLLLAKTETFDSSFLLDFPLDKLNYKVVFPIFEDFQKFMKLLITSVKDPVIIEHKSVLKCLCLVSRLLGNKIEPKTEIKPKTDLHCMTADLSSDRCLVEASAVAPTLTNGNTTTSINGFLSDATVQPQCSKIPWKPKFHASMHTKSQLNVKLSKTEPTESTSDMCLSDSSDAPSSISNDNVTACGIKAILVDSKCQPQCPNDATATDPKSLASFLRKIPAYCTKVKPKNKTEIMLQERCIELDQHVRRNKLGDYYRVELFLGWVLNGKFKFDVAAYEKFLKTFNFRHLNKTFFEDTWSLCSLFYKPFKFNQYLDELSDNDNFFVIQRKLSQADIQKSVMSSGNILLPGTSPCLLTKCDAKSHTIGQISIKLRVSQEDQTYGLVRKNQHQKYLEHYYMTLLGKDMNFSGLISLKILTKNDILTIVKHYSYFCITLIYKN